MFRVNSSAETAGDSSILFMAQVWPDYREALPAGAASVSSGQHDIAGDKRTEKADTVQNPQGRAWVGVN